MAEREMTRLQNAIRTGRSLSAMRRLATPVVILK